MRLSAGSEYGCLALLAIAERDGEPCQRAQIRSRFAIPGAFLDQILGRLLAAGILASRRGPRGGYRLERPAAEITIAEIVRALEGPIAPVRSVSTYFYQPTPLEESPAYVALFREVRDRVSTHLESISLQEIVDDERRHRETQR